MFGKKCPRCERKIEKKYEFCPYCGYNIGREKREKDYGLLGKNDDFDFPEINFRIPFGFNGIFNSLLKEVEKQFRKLDKELGREMKEKEKIRFKPVTNASGFSVSISTATGKKPEIKISGFGPEFENIKGQLRLKEDKEKSTKIKKPEISEEKMREIAKLPREEAVTNVRRLGNKIVYEIDLPGVDNMKNVIVNQLENSIEIKAFSKDKVYFKLLPVKLPILRYKLVNEKMILELGVG